MLREIMGLMDVKELKEPSGTNAGYSLYIDRSTCKVSLIIIFGQIIAAGLYNCLLHIMIAYNFGGYISKTPLKAVTCT